MNKKILIIVGILILIAAVGGIWWFQVIMAKNRKSIVQEFIKENLPEVSQPSSFDVKKTTDTTGRTFYVTNWTVNDLSFYASAFYNNGDGPDLMLSIPMPGSIGNLNATTALSFTREFFKTVGENWKCQKGDITEVCESSWVDGKDKRYTGIQNILPAGKSILYSCKIPFGSANFNQDWCLPAK